jgi:hypothetical protein
MEPAFVELRRGKTRLRRTSARQNPPSSNFGEAKPAFVLTDFGEAKEKELGRKHSTT